MQFSLVIIPILVLLPSLTLSQHNFRLPISVGSFEYQFVYNFSKYLHQTHKFNSFLIYRNLHISKTPACLIPYSLEQTLMDGFGQTIFILGPDNTIKLRNFIGTNNLAFIDITSVDDPLMKTVSATLQGLSSMPMIFIFKRPDYVVPNMQEIRQFFEWCWSVNIVNVVLTFRVIHYSLDRNCRPTVHYLQHQVFNYTPFPRLRVRNMTSQIYTSKVFLPEKISNVFGYKFNTPIYMDPPTVFLTPFEKHSHHRGEKHMAITGAAGRLYHEFIHSINGTIRLLPYINANDSLYHNQVLQMTANKSIDIGIHPFSEVFEFANLTKGSYPLYQANNCIIVPVIPEISRSDYISYAFQTIVWNIAAFSVLALGLYSFFWHYKQENLYNRIGLSILYGVGLSYQQPRPLHYFQAWNLNIKLFHTLILLCFFVVQQSFTTSLTALLSTSVMGEQIETVEDFLESGLEIMIDEFEKATYFDTERLPRNLRPRLFVTDIATLVSHRNAMNASFAYVITSEHWRMLTLQQHNLWKKKFRIASDELCTAKFFEKFPLQQDSPFEDSISIFSIVAQEAGLIWKWDDMSIHQAHEMNLIKVFTEDQKHPIPLSLGHFLQPLSIVIVWNFIGFLTFVVEILYYKWKSRVLKQKIELLMRKIWLRACKYYRSRN